MLPEDGRLPHRGVGANHHRRQLKARLVAEHDGPALLQGPFFREGHSSSFRRSIASSSRWFARRREGFCGERPDARTRRLTWAAGWQLTPNSLRITSATLSHVHTSPRKPCAGAPWAKSSGNLARSSSLRRGVAPGAILRLKPSTPSSRPRFIHWLTAPLLTPKASAISCCFHPSRWSSQALRRLPSRQSLACFESELSMSPFY